MHQSPSLFKKSPGLQTHGLLHASLDKIKACAMFFIAVSNIVSECVIMHAKGSLFHNDLCSSKPFQIAYEVTIYRLLFLLFFSAVPNGFKYRWNAPFSILVFKIVSVVPNRFTCRQNAPFTVPVFKIISVIPNTVRKHHLLSLFSKFPGGYPRPHASLCFGTKYVLFFLLKFQILFKKVSKGKL